MSRREFAETERLQEYLDLIEREREGRPAEAMLADEIRRLRRGCPATRCVRLADHPGMHSTATGAAWPAQSDGARADA